MISRSSPNASTMADAGARNAIGFPSTTFVLESVPIAFPVR